jgi:AcrR family transcriptional regulator
MDVSTKKSRRRTQEERREEAEYRLLEAAVRIIAKNGVETFTLADVGEAAGYSRGLPAHYFKTKAGLLAAVVRYIREEPSYFGWVPFNGHSPTTIDDVVGEGNIFFERCRKYPVVAKAFLAAMAGSLYNSELADAAAKLNANVIAKYEEAIHNGIKNGAIDSGIRAQPWAIMIMAASRGIVAQWLVHPKKVNLDLLRDELEKTIRHCFAPR